MGVVLLCSMRFAWELFRTLDVGFFLVYFIYIVLLEGKSIGKES